jgi:hypothetical protein
MHIAHPSSYYGGALLDLQTWLAAFISFLVTSTNKAASLPATDESEAQLTSSSSTEAHMNGLVAEFIRESVLKVLS